MSSGRSEGSSRHNVSKPPYSDTCLLGYADQYSTLFAITEEHACRTYHSREEANGLEEDGGK